jgi:hypothetical protein
VSALRKELRDQPLHVGWCAAVLLPVALWPSLPTFTLAGFMAGLIREVTEEGAPVTPAKVWRAITTSWLDLAFWTLGGALVGMIA